ncbi:MAG: pyridoxamine 5'-phosphate oxidase family protein [Rhodobacteraceae bacterium]|nr:pyridoxamine 5'-phosphate oxidase family protein [Paracoccaceae bacterium]
MTNPIRPTDEAARQMATDLLRGATTAALGVIEPDGQPMVSRIAFGLDRAGIPLTLVSQLSRHTAALLHPGARCSLLVGEPGKRGDPLTHPRLTVQAQPRICPRDAPEYEELAAHWLSHNPKAKLYIGFADFMFVRFDASVGHLNGGFGKAFTLAPADMGMPAP